MATNISLEGQDISFAASASLAAKRYHFVDLGIGTQQDLPEGTFCGAATDMPDGIVQDAPAANAIGSLRINGTSLLQVDGNVGAIAIGDELGPDAAGQGIKVTADKKTVGATALEAATAASVIIPVIIRHYTISV